MSASACLNATGWEEGAVAAGLEEAGREAAGVGAAEGRVGANVAVVNFSGYSVLCGVCYLPGLFRPSATLV